MQACNKNNKSYNNVSLLKLTETSRKSFSSLRERVLDYYMRENSLVCKLRRTKFSCWIAYNHKRSCSPISTCKYRNFCNTQNNFYFLHIRLSSKHQNPASSYRLYHFLKSLSFCNIVSRSIKRAIKRNNHFHSAIVFDCLQVLVIPYGCNR